MEWNDSIIDDALRRSAAASGDIYPEDLVSEEDLWIAIGGKRKRSKMMRLRKALAVAATVVLLAGAGCLWYYPKQTGQEVVSIPGLVPELLPEKENEAMEYIRRACAAGNIASHSPSFKELQSELKSSSAALFTINRQIRLYGNDELLLRAKTRIENHQARVIKAMVQLL